MSLNKEQRVNIADRIIILQSEIADREEAIKNLKSTLGNDYPETGEHVEDGRKITTYYSKRIDGPYAKKNYPELYDKVVEFRPTFNATLAKAKLTDEEYELCQKVSDELSVKVELLNE